MRPACSISRPAPTRRCHSSSPGRSRMPVRAAAVTVWRCPRHQSHDSRCLQRLRRLGGRTDGGRRRTTSMTPATDLYWLPFGAEGRSVRLNGRAFEALGSHVDVQAILDGLPAMIGYWDHQLHNVMANEAYVAYFGRSPEQIRGTHISELLGPDLYARNLPYIRRALAGEEQLFDRRILGPNGRVRYSRRHMFLTRSTVVSAASRSSLRISPPVERPNSASGSPRGGFARCSKARRSVRSWLPPQAGSSTPVPLPSRFLGGLASG